MTVALRVYLPYAKDRDSITGLVYKVQVQVKFSPSKALLLEITASLYFTSAVVEALFLPYPMIPESIE